jgi:hypothetical protein
MWAPDGTYRATNPTFGTGIAQSIVTAWAAVSPLLTMFNSDTAGGVSLFPDYIKLICAAAGASSTSGQLGAIVDTGNRFSSGGSTLTAVNAGKQGSASKATINFGALVAAAATAPRQIGRDTIKTQAAPCWVVGDEIFIKFGNFDGTSGPTNGAVTNLYPAPCGPVIVPPQSTLLVYLWNPANAVTPPSWEVEMGWLERVI